MHKKFNGRIMVRELMELSRITIGNMPSHPDYNNNGQNGLCFHWLGGVCPFENCRQKASHIPGKDVPHELVTAIVSSLGPGVEKMIKGERGTRLGGKRRH